MFDFLAIFETVSRNSMGPISRNRESMAFQESERLSREEWSMNENLPPNSLVSSIRQQCLTRIRGERQPVMKLTGFVRRTMVYFCTHTIILFISLLLLNTRNTETKNCCILLCYTPGMRSHG